MSAAFRGFLTALLVPSLVLFGAPAFAVDSCADATESLAAFDRAWRDSFPVVPGPVKLQPWLADYLGPHTVLEQAAFQRGLVVALEKVYAARVNASGLAPEVRDGLLKSLREAVNALLPGLGGSGTNGRDGAKGGGGGGDDGGNPGVPSGADDELAKNIESHLKNVSYRQCVGQTALLLVVSTVVTTGGALIVNWKRYAKENSHWISVLVTPESWQKALDDPDFRHNLTWNAVLMTSLGAMTCLSNKNAGRNVITAISALSSVADQYIATGKISLRQTLVDTLFIRYISFWKTSKVLQFSRSYAAAGGARPKLFEGSLQAVSELIGAFGYPLAVNFSKWGQTEGENFLGSFELFKREVPAAPEP